MCCNVPFIAIRSISDNKADNGQETISRNFNKAAHQSFKTMIPLID
jgi:nucleoside phosphorylase